MNGKHSFHEERKKERKFLIINQNQTKWKYHDDIRDTFDADTAMPCPCTWNEIHAYMVES